MAEAQNDAFLTAFIGGFMYSGLDLGMMLALSPVQIKKRRLGRAMKILPWGKGAWTDIAHQNF